MAPHIQTPPGFTPEARLHFRRWHNLSRPHGRPGSRSQRSLFPASVRGLLDTRCRMAALVGVRAAAGPSGEQDAQVRREAAPGRQKRLAEKLEKGRTSPAARGERANQAPAFRVLPPRPRAAAAPQRPLPAGSTCWHCQVLLRP